MATDLEKLVAKEGITIEATSGTTEPLTGMVAWNVTLKAKGRRMSTPFSADPGYAPSAADVVYSLCIESKSLEGTKNFEEWAAKFKMSPDSRRAFATWDKIQKSSPRFKKFLGRKYKEACEAKHRR